MEVTESTKLIFEVNKYKSDSEKDQESKFTYSTDEYGCFSHNSSGSYTGPCPQRADVQSTYTTYETDSHGCFNHATVHNYSGPIPNTDINPQSNYATYETDSLGNMIDNYNFYTGPKPNQSKKAQEILKVDAAHKASIEEALEKYFKKKSKRFLKGWYTTTIKKSTI